MTSFLGNLLYRIVIKRDGNDLVLVGEPRWRWVPQVPQADVRIPFDKLEAYR